MSETPTRPDELRTLEEKRRATGLSPVEEARRTELASAGATPRPRGFDVHAAAASVRAAVAAEPPRPEATAAWDLGAPAAVVSQAPPGRDDAVLASSDAALADAAEETMAVELGDIVDDLAANPGEAQGAPPAAELLGRALTVREQPVAEPAPGPAPLAEGASPDAGVAGDALELTSPLLVAVTPEPSRPTGPAPELGEPVDLATLAARPTLEPAAFAALQPAASPAASDAAAQPPQLAPRPPDAAGGALPASSPPGLPGTPVTELDATYEPLLAATGPEATEPAPLEAMAELEVLYPPPLPGRPELEPVFPDQARAVSPPPPLPAGEQASPPAEKLRVVLHTADGQVRRGLLSEFTPDAPELWLADVDGGPARPVAAGATRAIFFMLGPGEEHPPRRGRPVSLTFRDGRTLSGVSDDYHPEAPGFFVVPSGARTRTARVWVYRRALRHVDVGEPTPD